MNREQTNSFPPALERAIEVLDTFASSTGFDFSIKEISEELGIPYASTYRIIKCLTYYGFLSENPINRDKYKLGYKLISLGKAAIGYADFISVTASYLTSLSNTTNQSCKLATLTPDAVITLDQSLPQNGLTLISPIGMKRSIYESASGRILVALLPKTKREPYIRQFTTTNYHDMQTKFGSKEGFHQYLDETRAREYGLSLGEYAPNIGCISMPLFDYTGKAIAAISFSGLISNYEDESLLQNLISLLKHATMEISGKLGYTGELGTSVVTNGL
jgi:DNA-binding IclR family transcriptional regulator